MSTHEIRIRLQNITNNSRALTEIIAPDPTTSRGLPLTDKLAGDAAKIRAALLQDFDALRSTLEGAQ